MQIPWLQRARIVAKPGFNRWLIPPASVAIHSCIGSVYAWSIFNTPLTRVRGVVVSAPDDWSLSQVIWIFTVAIVCLGLAAAFAGRWVEKAGPRMVGSTASVCWGGGFLIAALGIHFHQLWLLYLGYGVLGGCGLGLGYVSPVSTLIKWFPDRRGMAAGMAIMGFGGGAIIGAPLNEALLKHFSQSPVFIGAEGAVKTENRGGRNYAKMDDGSSVEVVVLDPKSARSQASRIPGIYVVNSGSTGVVQAFLFLGFLYTVVMLMAAFAFRVPAEGWLPEGWSPDTSGTKMISRSDVDINEALKTPQFYLLWIVLCFNVTAGIGVLGVAKTMMTDIFGSAYPTIVTARFASFYVLMISVFNMAGRFFWASVSDKIGRKQVYSLFFILGVILYLCIPILSKQAATSHSIIWLIAFYATTMLIFTMYGGGFATIPAYIADLFGSKNVGGIHGRILTAWSTAGVLGPVAITYLREKSRLSAIHELVSRVDPAAFANKFGAPLEKLEELITSNTVTIARLLELTPGTTDPTSTLYNTTMVVMAGLLGIALLANLMIRPVDPSHHLK